MLFAKIKNKLRVGTFLGGILTVAIAAAFLLYAGYCAVVIGIALLKAGTPNDLPILLGETFVFLSLFSYVAVGIGTCLPLGIIGVLGIVHSREGERFARVFTAEVWLTVANVLIGLVAAGVWLYFLPSVRTLRIAFAISVPTYTAVVGVLRASSLIRYKRSQTRSAPNIAQ